MTWSVPVGRYFGIRVRIHVFFLGLVIFQVIDAGTNPVAGETSLTAAKDALWTLAILFFSVLFHEFGHCFAARAVGGEAENILMWPLGGLASVSVANTARDQFITTVWGPLVNVGICVASASGMLLSGFRPCLNPFGTPLDFLPLPGSSVGFPEAPLWVKWLGVAFGLNWILFLFNLIPAFPMDGGRMFRCLLWNRMGFVRATFITVQVAKLSAIAMGLIGLLQRDHNFWLVGIAIFVYLMSESERRMVEAGMLFDDTMMGYDFSQGYTSLARSSPKPKARRMSTWERWRRRREEMKRQREKAALEEQERRVDEILAKLHREGMASLTDQERRFLTRASEKYRSRDQAHGE